MRAAWETAGGSKWLVSGMEIESYIGNLKSGRWPLATGHSPHVVLAGGGTGGHLFPGLAVAGELRAIDPAVRVTFATGCKPMEQQLVASAGFEHLALPCQPLPHGPRSAWRFVTENVRGFRAARRFLRSTDVSVVVGLGGYASVPMARAATALGVPLALLEQNAVPGRATRWLAPRASVVCLALAEARRGLKAAGPIRVTGTPVRQGFAPNWSASEREQCRDDEATTRSAPAVRQLLVLGGSGGSRSLNELVPRALHLLRDRLRGWQIIHQTGPRDQRSTTELYRKFDIRALITPFVNPLPPVLKRTDLAICRAGGSTLAELAVAGVPAVLLPWPGATDDHQRRNAEVYLRAGAARMVDQRAITSRVDEALADVMSTLLTQHALRQELARRMRSLGHPMAAWHAANMILDAATVASAATAA